MAFSGMTPDQIDVEANRLRTQSQELTMIRSRVTALIDNASSSWQGADMRAFRSTWHSSYSSKVAAVIAILDSMTSELVQQAAQQREASAASGVGSSSVNMAIADLWNPFKKPLNADGTLNMPQPLTGPVSTADSDMEPQDIDQGNAGDCWFMAALISLVNTPEGRDQLRNNMVWDPARNGYVVTLYRDGKPEQYFVDQTFSDGANGGKGWQAVYEAALVQYMGSASGVNGDFGQTAFEILTGQDATLTYQKSGSTQQDINQISAALDNGQVVTLGSNKDYWIFTSDQMPLVTDVQDSNGVWHTNQTIDIVRNHEYSVERVDSDGNLYVRNPWGPNNAADGGVLIKLTPQQFEDYFMDQSIGSLK